MANCTRFTMFPIFCHQSISFLEKSQKLSFLLGGGISAIFFEFFNFLESLHMNQWLKMTHNGQFWSPKWLRLAQNEQFWLFCIFFNLFSKMRLKYTQNGQSSLNFRTRAHLLQPKCQNFGEISKSFAPTGGTINNFWQNFNYLSMILTPICRSNLYPHRAHFFAIQTGSKWAPNGQSYATISNWWKLKYLSRISTDLHQTFKTGLMFSWASWNESKECYAMIKTNEKLKYLSRILIDLHLQFFLNRARYSEPVEMSPRIAMLRSKLMKTLVS